MYGKLFASMFRGSLYGKWHAIVTFQQMIILADQDGTVDYTPEAMSATTSIPLDIIQQGIALLEAPDPTSRTPDEEGRRILRIDPDRPWGWHIVNYAHYRAIRTAEERRAYHRDYWRKNRTAQPDSTRTQQSQPIAEAEAEAEACMSDTYTDTARFMFQLILSLNPKQRKPNFSSWANEIRLMCERDGRTDEEIRSLFSWANQHHFWKTNILSPATLRKQWDKLVIQRSHNGGFNGTHQQIDNSAVGKVRRANEERERRNSQ